LREITGRIHCIPGVITNLFKEAEHGLESGK